MCQKEEKLRCKVAKDIALAKKAVCYAKIWDSKAKEMRKQTCEALHCANSKENLLKCVKNCGCEDEEGKGEGSSSSSSSCSSSSNNKGRKKEETKRSEDYCCDTEIRFRS